MKSCEEAPHLPHCKEVPCGPPWESSRTAITSGWDLHPTSTPGPLCPCLCPLQGCLSQRSGLASPKPPTLSPPACVCSGPPELLCWLGQAPLSLLQSPLWVLTACTTSSCPVIQLWRPRLICMLPLYILRLYRIPPITKECIFFLGLHETFSIINHILNPQMSLNTFKRIQVNQVYSQSTSELN